MKNQETVTVSVVRAFSADAATVFGAFVDPAKACRFMFRTPAGEMIRTEIDARTGGSFMITERRDGEDVEHLGEFFEYDPPRRLAFTFRVPKYSATADRVFIDVAPSGSGCAVTLTHELQPEHAGYADSSREGWSGILRGLAEVVEG